MPRQAVALKKNRCGTSPVSKMSDNEDATAALRYSCELRVDGSIGPLEPEFAQRPEEGTKVPSASRRQDTGDVFPDEVARPDAINQAEIDEGEVSAGVCEPLSEACDGEGLAGGSAHENVN
jgi:hypothetical protein